MKARKQSKRPSNVRALPRGMRERINVLGILSVELSNYTDRIGFTLHQVDDTLRIDLVPLAPAVPTRIELHAVYRGTIRYRRGPGFTVRPELEPYDGRRLVFSAAWIMDESDPEIYRGEVAMRPDSQAELLTTWIASGDLVDVTRLNDAELREHYATQQHYREVLRRDPSTLTHAAHCCAVHGCKYGEEVCPVVTGAVQREPRAGWCQEPGLVAQPKICRSAADT